MANETDSRRAILERRARFVTAALAALAGCAPASGDPPQGARGQLPSRPSVEPGAADGDAAAASDTGAAPEPIAAYGEPADAGVDARVVIRPCLSIAIMPRVEFARGSATPTRASFDVIDAAAKTLESHPEIALEIEGHTDDTEPAALGQKRADAVQRELVRRGVDRKRLTTANAGRDEPLDPAKSAPARARNRRVDFNVKRP